MSHYVYNWRGYAMPSSRPAAETRELSGDGIVLSTMEKNAIVVGALAFAGWYLFLRKKR